MKKQVTVWMVLSCLLSFLSFSPSGLAGVEDKESILSSLNTKIALLETQLSANPADAKKRKLFKKLASLHKKRIKLSPTDETRWAFIQDDIQWGTGAYAVPLLESLNADNEARIRLMELNSNKAGKQIRIKKIGENPIRSFYKTLFRKNRYRFDEAKVDALSHALNKNELTPDQINRVKAVDPVFTTAQETAAEAPKEEIPEQKTEPLPASVEPAEAKPAEPAPLSSDTAPATASTPAPVETAVSPLPSSSAPSEEENLEQDKQEAEKIAEAEVQSMKEESEKVASQMASEQPDPSPSVSEEEAEAVKKKTERDPAPVSSAVIQAPLSTGTEASQADTRYYWEIAKVIQQVQVLRHRLDYWEALKPGDRIYEGDTLKTGPASSVLLLIHGLNNEDSYSQLFENTELKVVQLSKDNLDHLSDVYLDLILGEVFVNVEKLPQTSTFKIKTPTAVAGVRGTRFSVQVLLNQVSRILVFRGVVGVTPDLIAGAIRELKLKAGEFLEQKQNVPGEPKIMDEATAQEYQAKAEQLAQALLDHMQTPPSQEPKSEGPDGEKSTETKEGLPAEDSDSHQEGEDQGPGGPGGSGEDGGNGQDPAGATEAPGAGESFYSPEAGIQDFISNDPFDPRSPAFDPVLAKQFFQNGEFNPDSLYGGQFEEGGVDETQADRFFQDFFDPNNANGGFAFTGFGSAPPPENPVDTLQLQDGQVIFADSAQGNDATGTGSKTNPVRTLEKAMKLAKAEPDQDLVILALLFRDNQPEYTVPGDGLVLRPLTGVVGVNQGSSKKHAVVNGGGSLRVFRSDGGPNFLGNLILKNPDASGSPRGTGVEADHSTMGFQNVIFAECQIGLLLNGEGSRGRPEEVPEFLHDLGLALPGGSGENGVDLFQCAFLNCSHAAILNPATADAGTLDLAECRIENGGAGLLLRGNGGMDARVFKTRFSNNNPGGSNPLIDIGTGSIDAEFSECEFSSNSMGAAGGSLILSDANGTLALIKSRFFGNNIAGGESVVKILKSRLWMENSLLAGNDGGASVIHLQGGGDFTLLNCTVSRSAATPPAGIRVLTPGPNLFKLINSAVTGFNVCVDGNPGTNANHMLIAHCFLANNTFNAGGTRVTTNNYPNTWDIGGTFNMNGNGNFASWNGLSTNANLDGNPLYHAETSSDYKPNSTSANSMSPLIDAGAPTGPLFQGAGDLLGNPRNVGGIDIGAVENQGGSDPIVSGRLYDSATGETLSGGAISIVEADTNATIETQEAGEFSFDVLPASYYFAVSKEGYYFPSTRKAVLTSGDHGSSFTVTDGVNQRIEIPLDASPYLIIRKTANKKQATPGEVVTFNVSILNAYWYSAVDNFKLSDTLPTGFKYISGSARQDNRALADPSTAGRILSFPIASLPRLGSTNLSFQAAVSTGVAEGNYSAGALCLNSEDTVISNESRVKIEVAPDMLFTNCTLVGRVFRDENGNGRYDPGEPGVKNAQIATETGALIESDEFGLYHLANVSAGRHVVQVDPASLPEGLVSGSPHGVSVEVQEGSIAKANIPIVKESGNRPRCQFFLVSLGEVTFSDNKISGNMEMVQKDPAFDEDFRVDGRGAFFLRGKIQGKYLVTASYDSERLSRDPKNLRKNRLFTNLDPDKYYPIYGDGSKVNYDATDTQDALYLLVEWEESFARWGNMDLDWPLYRRAMHGGQVLLKSTEKTSFNESQREAEGFTATSDHQTTHEEFIGTGTSLYHLGNTPLVEGSEQVHVEFRNRLGQTAYQRIPLREELDYNIDYDSGRIILKRPLSSTVMNYSQSILSQDILAGSQAILVVDYEYQNRSVFDRQNFGGRVKNNFGDHLSLEASYAEEERTKDPYKLASGTTTYKVNENSSLSATYSQSRESFSGGGFSYDSGLTLGSQSADAKTGKEGDSWNLSGNSYLFDKLNLSGSYSEQDAGFSARASLGASDTKRLEGTAVYDLSENWKVGASHLNNESSANSSLDQALSVVDHLHRTNLFVETEREKWDSRLEYSNQDVGLPYDGTLYLGSMPPRGKQLAALRLGYKPWERHRYYVIGQTTLQEDSRDGLKNDMVTLGAELPLLERVDVQMEGRSGSLGDSALVNLILNEDADEQSHIGFETGTQKDFGKFEKISFAKTYVLPDGTQYRFLKDYSYYRNRVLNGDVMEASIPLNRNWSLGLSYEISHVDKNETQNAIEREVATLRYNFIEPDLARLFGKVEWREDKDLEASLSTKHLYLEDDLTLQATEDLSWMLRGALGYAQEENSSRDAFDFKQAGTGLGWRPKNNDWLNLLARYTYTQDLPLEGRTLFLEDGEERKHVTSLDSIFDLSEMFQLVEKVAYRNMQSRVGNRGWQESETSLWINGLNVKILEKWGIGVEYRILANTTFDDKKSGFLAQLSYDLSEVIAITVGYNFTAFDDNLSNRDEYDRSGGFVRLNGKY